MTKTIEKLNYLVADAQVLYTKLHNFHWNVKGPHFYQIHTKTEEFYNHFATLYDDLAERVIQLGGTPYVTLKEILENTRIEEYPSTKFTTAELFQSLKEDFKFLLSEFRNLGEIVDGDAASTALVDEQITFLEKEIWMLEASAN